MTELLNIHQQAVIGCTCDCCMQRPVELFPGYMVQHIPEAPGEICFAYLVTGPRGKTWNLLRNRVTPHALFPVGDNGSTKIRGYGWFSDRSGRVRPSC